MLLKLHIMCDFYKTHFNSFVFVSPWTWFRVSRDAEINSAWQIWAKVARGVKSKHLPRLTLTSVKSLRLKVKRFLFLLFAFHFQHSTELVVHLEGYYLNTIVNKYQLEKYIEKDPNLCFDQVKACSKKMAAL